MFSLLGVLNMEGRVWFEENFTKTCLVLRHAHNSSISFFFTFLAFSDWCENMIRRRYDLNLLNRSVRTSVDADVPLYIIFLTLCIWRSHENLLRRNFQRSILLVRHIETAPKWISSLSLAEWVSFDSFFFLRFFYLYIYIEHFLQISHLRFLCISDPVLSLTAPGSPNRRTVLHLVSC